MRSIWTRNNLVFGAKHLMSRHLYLHLFEMERLLLAIWHCCLLGKASLGTSFPTRSPSSMLQHPACPTPAPQDTSHFAIAMTCCPRTQDQTVQPSSLHLSWSTYHPPATHTHGWAVIVCACSETSSSPLNLGRFTRGRGAELTPSIWAAKPSSR